jgi:hypothetical protein
MGEPRNSQTVNPSEKQTTSCARPAKLRPPPPTEARPNAISRPEATATMKPGRIIDMSSGE